MGSHEQVSMHEPFHSVYFAPTIAEVKKADGEHADRIESILTAIDQQGESHLDIFSSPEASFAYTKVDVNKIFAQHFSPPTESPTIQTKEQKKLIYVVFGGWANTPAGHPFTQWDMIYERVFSSILAIQGAISRGEKPPQIEIYSVGSPNGLGGRVSEEWAKTHTFDDYGKLYASFIQKKVSPENPPHVSNASVEVSKEENPIEENTQESTDNNIPDTNQDLSEVHRTRIILHGMSTGSGVAAKTLEYLPSSYHLALKKSKQEPLPKRSFQTVQVLQDNPVAMHTKKWAPLKMVQIPLGFCIEIGKFLANGQQKSSSADENAFTELLTRNLNSKGLLADTYQKDQRWQQKASLRDIRLLIDGSIPKLHTYARQGVFDMTSVSPVRFLNQIINTDITHGKKGDRVLPHKLRKGRFIQKGETLIAPIASGHFIRRYNQKWNRVFPQPSPTDIDTSIPLEEKTFPSRKELVDITTQLKQGDQVEQALAICLQREQRYLNEYTIQQKEYLLYKEDRSLMGILRRNINYQYDTSGSIKQKQGTIQTLLDIHENVKRKNYDSAKQYAINTISKTVQTINFLREKSYGHASEYSFNTLGNLSDEDINVLNAQLIHSYRLLLAIDPEHAQRIAEEFQLEIGML